MDSVPDDVLCHILSFLTDSDLNTAKLINHHFNKFCNAMRSCIDLFKNPNDIFIRPTIIAYGPSFKATLKNKNCEGSQAYYDRRYVDSISLSGKMRIPCALDFSQLREINISKGFPMTNRNEAMTLLGLSKIVDSVFLDRVSPSMPLLKAIENTPSLTSLKISDCRLSKDIQIPPEVQTLDLSYNTLSGTTWKSILTLRNLKNLNIMSTNSTGEQINSLSKLTTLESLNMSWNRTRGDYQCIANLVNLTSLHASIMISTQGLYDTPNYQPLSRLRKLQELDLECQNLESSDFEWISSSMPIKSLFLGFNFITSLGIEYICRLKTLQHLDVSWNRIRDDGAFLIANILGKTLITLDISMNSLTRKGADSLVVLPLEELDLSRNLIPVEATITYLRKCPIPKFWVSMQR